MHSSCGGVGVCVCVAPLLTSQLGHSPGTLSASAHVRPVWSDPAGPLCWYRWGRLTRCPARFQRQGNPSCRSTGYLGAHTGTSVDGWLSGLLYKIWDYVLKEQISHARSKYHMLFVVSQRSICHLGIKLSVSPFWLHSIKMTHLTCLCYWIQTSRAATLGKSLP